MARSAPPASDPPPPEGISRITPLDREYAELEEASVRAVREFLSSPGDNPQLLAKAKIAAGALGSVQSHFKTAMAGRVLDFDMARVLTSDPDKLAEYIRLTQPTSGILPALPEPAAKAAS